MRSKERRRTRDREYRKRLKADCFAVYGGVCSVEGCEERNIDKLELHHPGGGGNKDRADRIGRGLESPGGWNFYQKLKRAGWPEGYAVVCTKHHDQIHGRQRGRRKCAPGNDPFRYDDVVPF